jgi:hypothetical protein
MEVIKILARQEIKVCHMYDISFEKWKCKKKLPEQ